MSTNRKSSPAEVAAGNEHGNPREQLLAAADWLGDMDEDLSFRLRSAEDGLKLWRYWQARPADLPEMADEECDGYDVAAARVAAVGYDPLGLDTKRRRSPPSASARVVELESVLRSVQQQFRLFSESMPDGFDSRVFGWVDDLCIDGAEPSLRTTLSRTPRLRNPKP